MIEQPSKTILGYNSIIHRHSNEANSFLSRYSMDVVALYTQIDKTIEVNAGVIVMENPSGFPRNETNIYLVGRQGEIIWKAEKPDPYTYFSRVKLNEDGETFSAYTLGGHACELDLKTGKLISFISFR